MKTFFRYLSLYRRVFIQAVMQNLAYPQNFVVWMLVDVAWAVVNIGFFRIILFNIPEISGWTFDQLAIPLGILYLLNTFIWGFFYGNMKSIPEYVNKGELDLLLVKPVNSQFMVSTRQIGLGTLPSAAAGLYLLWYGFQVNSVSWQMAGVVPLALLASGIISYSLWLMTVTLSFWTNRLYNVPDLFANAVDIARYPVAIFRQPAKFILTFILPFAILGFLPAEIILGKISPLWLLWPMGLTILLLFISSRFWKFSLCRYQSASS
ncbi:ABC-2 family transporter protein [Candidatus Collierbacteria bacterium]|nr:ABC-2 family transporter protein [Candidatus Collierbacteria bacterium]